MKSCLRRTTFVALVIAAALILICPPALAQATIHVDDDAPNDPGPGDTSISDPLEDGSLDHPFDAIQEAIDAAVNGDTVLVADGTYTGEGNRDIDFLGKAITVRSAGGPEACTVDLLLGSYRGFYFHSEESEAARLEGMTIVGNGWFGDPGGGIYCNNASPTIIGNVITACHSFHIGGGICVYEGSPFIEGNIITGCSAYHGGGIYVYNGSPLIEGNTILNNHAEADTLSGSGGGVCCRGEGAAIIRGNDISENSCEADGGGIYSDQNAIIIEGNTINENLSAGEYFGGGGISLLGCSGARVANNTISLNVSRSSIGGAGSGGGISCTSSAGVSITGNRIIDNEADVYGGGISFYAGWGRQPRSDGRSAGGVSICANNLIAGNEVTGSSGEGGGISCRGVPVSFINNTIVVNSANNPGGGIGCRNADINVLNSVVRGNSAPSDPSIHLQGTSTATVAHSNIEGGWTGPGNIDADPLFVSGPDGDYHLSQVAAGQGVDSPCVDTGQNLAAATCWPTTGGIECLSGFSTRTDGINDQGTSDMGYHYPALNPVSAWLSCQPSSGVLPLTATIALGLENELAGAWRQVAGRIDLVLGNGTAFPNWRAGHLVLAPGEGHAISWNQLIPEILPAYGDNRFTLVAEDVTPAPWNQPPYPPSGSTDWAQCTVTGEYR